MYFGLIFMLFWGRPSSVSITVSVDGAGKEEKKGYELMCILVAEAC